MLASRGTAVRRPSGRSAGTERERDSPLRDQHVVDERGPRSIVASSRGRPGMQDLHLDAAGDRDPRHR